MSTLKDDVMKTEDIVGKTTREESINDTCCPRCADEISRKWWAWLNPSTCHNQIGAETTQPKTFLDSCCPRCLDDPSKKWWAWHNPLDCPSEFSKIVKENTKKTSHKSEKSMISHLFQNSKDDCTIIL